MGMNSLLLTIFLGLFTGTGLCIFEGITAAWAAISIGTAIILLLLFVGKHNLLKNRRLIIFSSILAFLFSLFTIIGRAMNMDGSIRFLFSSKMHILSGLLGFFSYFVLFFALVCCIWEGLVPYIKKSMISVSLAGETNSIINKKPFLFSFLILTIAYFFYLVISYPALFMGDDSIMLAAVSGDLSAMTTHHPIGYSLFLSAIFRAGHFLSGSWNATAFIYAVIQIIIFSFILSFGNKILIEDCKINKTWIIVLLVYYVCTPIIQNYSVVITKDTLYSAFLLLISTSILSMYRLGINRKNSFSFIIGTLSVLFCRNEGVYIILILLVVLFFSCKKYRKYTLSYFVIFLFISFLYSSVFVNIAGITRGSKREMLSVPIMQTARCIKDNSDQITEEEKNIIINAFCDETWGISDINELSDRYDPMISDDIKASYSYDIFSNTSINYLKTWFKMGLKYPVSYLDAFIAKNYEYFYLNSQLTLQSIKLSNWSLQHVNTERNMDIHHPAIIEKIHSLYESAVTKICSYAPLSLFNSSALIIWIFLLWFLGLLYSRNYFKLIFAVIPILIIAICLVSPCNGSYGRYQFPLFIYLPWTIFATSTLKFSDN